MAFDAHANLALAPVLVPPSPALSGTSLIITGGYAALFPAVPFNVTVYPAGVTPTAANAEIVRVTNIVGDVFTITRAQEGTTAKAIASGWSIANTITVKVITDIENAISSGGGGGAAISAGANSQNTGTVQFSNSNGVTFGLSNNGVMTASHNGITSQSVQPVAASASNGSFAFSTLGFSNANGVTFGTSAGSIITASVGTAAGGNSVNFSAGTESANLGSIVFSNSNGVSFGLNAGTVTAQHNGITSQSNQQNTVYAVGNTLVSSSGTNNASAFSFSGLGNVSVGVVGGSVLVSGQELAASASNGSFTFHTLAFSNANNVTFGTSNGSIVTASVNAGGGGSINFSAGTQSADLASIVFSNSNGVSFGLSNGTITASASGGGGAAGTLSFYENNPFLNATQFVTYPNNRMVLDPLPLAFNLSFNEVRMVYSLSNSFAQASVSTVSTGSAVIECQMAFYSRSVTDSGATNFSNSSIIVTHASQAWTLQISGESSSSSKSVTYYWQTDTAGGSSSSSQSTNASNMVVNGMNSRMMIGHAFVTSIPFGEHWFGRQYNITETNFASRAFIFSVYELSWNANSTNRSSLGDTGAGNVNGNNMILPGLGFYSTSTGNIPATINLVDDIANSNIANQGRRYYVFKA